MNITTRQLKAFLLTARHQSFSRAAEHMYITQSGMSLLVRELESQLGFRLLDRTTRRVTLTDPGATFLPIAEHSLLALEAAAGNIGRSALDADRRFSVGATPLVAADLLAPAVAAYGKREPGVEIRLHDAHRGQLIEMVRSGEIDAGLSASTEDTGDAERIPLARFSFMVIGAREHAAAPSPPVRWSDIAQSKLVGGPPGNPIQEIVDVHLKRSGRHHPPELVCNYMETQIAMVESGAGIAVMPTFTVPTCLKRNVAMRALIDPVVTSDLDWIVRPGRPLPAAAERFSVFLKEFVSGWTERWPPMAAQAA